MHYGEKRGVLINLRQFEDKPSFSPAPLPRLPKQLANLEFLECEKNNNKMNSKRAFRAETVFMSEISPDFGNILTHTILYVSIIIFLSGLYERCGRSMV